MCNLGVLQWLTGGSAVLLCQHWNAYGDGAFQSQLGNLYRAFRNWANATDTPHSQPRFTVKMVRGAETDYAELSHKAYNGRVLLELFSHALRALLPNWHADNLFMLVLGTVQHMADYMNKIEQYPIYLTLEQAHELHRVGTKMIRCYFSLSQKCRECDLMLFPLRPKLHVLKLCIIQYWFGCVCICYAVSLFVLGTCCMMPCPGLPAYTS